MSKGEKLTLRVSHRFTASSERVYDAWLDPASLCKWLFATKDGTIVRTEVDARVGGTFVVVDRRDGVDVVHEGTYLELERPRRIVFLLRVPTYSHEQERVVVEIEGRGNGCELTLSQELDPALASRRPMIEHGWGELLAALARVL